MSTKTDFTQVLNILLKIWIVCFGSFAILAVAGWFMPHFWLPILSFSLILAVIWSGNRFISANHINCSLITHYTIYTLFAATIVMMAMNYVYERELNVPWLYMAGDKAMTTVNMPYITSCIIFPLASVFFLIAVIRRSKTQYCAHCHERAGFSIQEALKHVRFEVEAKFVIRLFLILSVLISVIVVGYFLLYFDNTNINTSDTYFLFFFPALCYLLSIVYLSMRFQNIKFEYNITVGTHSVDTHTQVRLMVVCRDSIMLRQVIEGPDAPQLWDTPATYGMVTTDNVTVDDAHSTFASLSGASTFKIRHLFDTSTSVSNAFHFAAFVNDCDEVVNLEGEWFNIYQIDTMLKAGIIARPFAYEIHRVYTMTMAWKSYDRNGNRLYPIKNYKPAFRFSDFKDWDIDYTDMNWMMVAENNADRPFFKLRQFWRRYVSGVNNKWKRND